MQHAENFTNRWGIVLASLAMAIGAGNLWRFPRLAGQYGGSFIILWILFLFIWSIPILLSEFAIGKKFKNGTIASFTKFAGKPYTWMGLFITICTLFITFYYSVVTAWSVRYLSFSIKDIFSDFTSSPTLKDNISANPDFLQNQWVTITNGDVLTISINIIVVIAGCLLLYKGIQNGLEKANRILIPTLFILLIIISIIALSLEGGARGLEYMFAINPEHFTNPNVWIEALSQSAWSTGAGWGLIMTISSYAKDKEDVTLNTFIGGFGNNTASLMAGMAILPAVFALAPSETDAISYLQAGNQALTFSIIPNLFTTIPGGSYLSLIFFAAFTLAAFSSLLPMLELFIKNLGDLGSNRHSAVIKAAIFCVLFGIPSAYSADIFNNQDWVWGIGLIFSGLFIIFAVIKYGLIKFKTEFIDTNSDFKVPTKYFAISLPFNIILGVVLIIWWMSRDFTSGYAWLNANGNWNVFSSFSNATIITQIGIVILLGLLFNTYLYKKFIGGKK